VTKPRDEQPAVHTPRPSDLRSLAGLSVAVPRRSAFTLLETIVSVGAVAIVAVGLAAIFSAVGKTVAGGQRLSTLNQYSALLEERLRDDMDRMTREGFLVIRQQWVDVNGDGVIDPAVDRVPLSQEDTAARARRVDEIMFFAEGRFQTARPSMHPGVVAESDAARIYYGHGQPRRVPVVAPGSEDSELYFRPALSDRNNDALARLGIQDSSNPSRFAGNWTLIRHQTLLVEPSVAPQPPISGLVFGFDPNTAGGRLVLSNKDGQIALQPAAGSLFRSLARRFPDNSLITAGAFLYPDFERPAFNSGIVDIACSDLAELRTFVMLYPGAPNTITTTTDVAGGFSAGRIFARTPLTQVAARPLPGAAASIDLMHAWMDDAMPSQSAPAGSDLTDYRGAPGVDPAATRLRTEVAGPDLLRVVSGAATGDAREQAFRRADQLALASAGLLPRCSEFIVEWSFGNTFANGQTIWHGLERREDSDGNGVINLADQVVAFPFIPDTGSATDRTRVRTRVAGSTFHDLTERVIYGYTPTATQSSLTSYFGYVDPTYAPATASQPKALPCPWPRMIRVTVTLSDAIDPTIESTFQYVFRTPENPGEAQN
jgi:type II secretory pathway pseudopilin PulG